jgi:putative endonuclease
MTIRREIGNLGEEMAARYLLTQGYQIMETNFRCRSGEIDIIARKFNCYHFVEVKTRCGDDYGTPAESVTAKKQHRIMMTAKYYLTSKGIRDVPIQFDVIEIEIGMLTNCF